MDAETLYSSARGWSAWLGIVALLATGEGVFRMLRATNRFPDRDRLERLGLPLLLGPATLPHLIVALDLARVPVTRISLLAGAALLLAAGWAVSKRTARSGPGGATSPQATPADSGFAAPAFSTSPVAWLFALFGIGYLVLSVTQTWVYPPRVYDALVGWDAVGKILAYEGKLLSSVYTEIIFNAQAVYAPFSSTNQGFWYLFYPLFPRAWVPWLAAGFLLCLWSRTRRWTGSHTAAGAVCFLVFQPPELAFHLTVGQTDLPAMIFTTLAFVATIDFVQRRGGILPVALWSLAATTARSEGVLFAFAVTVVAFLRNGRGRSSALWPVVLSTVYFAFWNGYFVQIRIGYDPGIYFRESIAFEAERWAAVLRNAWDIIWSAGMVAWLLPLIPVLWIGGWMGRRIGMGRSLESGMRTSVQLAGLLAIAFLVYMPFFYMWNDELNPLWTMAHTFKRGFFRFIPGLFLVAFSTPPLLLWMRRCDGTLTRLRPAPRTARPAERGP